LSAPSPAADLRCRGCGALLGRATPCGLVVAEVVRLPRSVTFECMTCGRRDRWHPLPAGTRAGAVDTAPPRNQ
jgi:hypothetical protein